MPSCPYCGRVLRYMEENQIKIPMKNTSENSDNRNELLQIGGKTQVPCLVIDGIAKYESLDIIEWFKDNKDKINS